MAAPEPSARLAEMRAHALRAVESGRLLARMVEPVDDTSGSSHSLTADDRSLIPDGAFS
jgi:hypothetical protein